MSDSAQPRHHDDIQIPRVLRWGAAGLVMFSFAAVMIGQATDRGLSLTPPAEAAETRTLMFAGQPGGEIEVVDAVSGQMVALLSADQDGFIRGVLRGLTRGRAVTRTAGADVYVLTRWDDGRLSISDPVSGERFDLNSFGSDNLQAFARLLRSREDAR